MTQFQGNAVDGDFLFVDLSYSQSGNSSTISYALYWAFRSPSPLDRDLDAGSFSIGGVGLYSNANPYNYTGNFTSRNVLLANGSRSYGHDGNGNLSVNVSGSVKPWQNPASSFSATYSLPRITRPPSQPGTPSATALGSLPEGRVSVSWGAPADNGGLGIDGYNVFANGGLAQQTGNTTSTTLTYTPGTSLSFFVQARNAAGTSSSSGTSNPVKANGNPAVTSMASASTGTVNKNSVNLSWNAADPRVGSIVGYYVFRSGSLVSTVGNTTSLVLNDSTANPDLPPNTSLSFSVAARNQFSDANSTHAGLSNALPATSSATSSGPPGAPTWPASGAVQNTSDSGTVPANSLRISWVAPSSFGNPATISSYTVFWYRLSQPATVFSATVPGTTYTTPANLTAGVDYRIYVNARNTLSGGADGIGPNSTEQTKQSISPAEWADNSLNPTVRVGVPYSDGVSATFPATYVVLPNNSALPPGIVHASGVLSGTPTTQGSYSFSIQATITENPTPIAQSFSLYVLPGARRRQLESQVPVQNIRRLASGVWVEVGTENVVSGSPMGANRPIGMHRWNGSSWVSTTTL
jgi:hypothetical protein